MASKYLKEFEELNTTTDSIYDLEDYEVLIILEDGTNLTSWDNVPKESVKYVSEDLSNCDNLKDKYNGFSNLEAVVIKNISKEIKEFDCMFYDCCSLVDISCLKDFDTSNIVTIVSMFEGCSSLTDLSSLAEWNTSELKDASRSFARCSSLTDLSPLAHWDVSNIKSIKSMFRHCSSLVDVSCFSNWDLPLCNVREIFLGCPNIEKYPNWRVEYLDVMKELDHTSQRAVTNEFYTRGFDLEPSAREEYYSILYNGQKKRVFEAFKDEEALAPSEIAKKENISSSTVRKNLNIFLEKDLVYITNPERKRNRTYSLTEEGKKVMDLLK